MTTTAIPRRDSLGTHTPSSHDDDPRIAVTLSFRSDRIPTSSYRRPDDPRGIVSIGALRGELALHLDERQAQLLLRNLRAECATIFGWAA